MNPKIWLFEQSLRFTRLCVASRSQLATSHLSPDEKSETQAGIKLLYS